MFETTNLRGRRGRMPTPRLLDNGEVGDEPLAPHHGSLRASGATLQIARK